MPAKTKRANGEGTIYQRKEDGLWVGQYIVGYKTNGKPNRKPVYGKTKTEVIHKLRDAQTSVDNGMFIESDKMTVEQWMRTWHAVYVVPSKKTSTADNYYNNIMLHIAPALGCHKLPKLRIEPYTGLLQ